MTETIVRKNSWWLNMEKYSAVFAINWATNLAYIGNIFARSGTMFFRIWIFTSLYTVTYTAYGVNEVGGLAIPALIWCLTLSQGFQIATKPSVSRAISDEVQSGQFAYAVSRPYSYIWFHFAAWLGRSAPNLLINVLVGIIGALIFVGMISFTPVALLAGVLLLFLGYILDFFMAFVIGLFSFWVEDISAFLWIYSKGQMVFGGMILPLALFPDFWRNIAELLPFSQMFYGAARLAVNFQSDLFWKYLMIQIGWILICAFMAVYLFRKGLKYVASNGG